MSRTRGLAKNSESHWLPDGTLALEVVFRGSHEPGTATEIQQYLKEVIETHRPGALVVNLLSVKYSCGDDIGGALLAGWVSLRQLGGARQFRILAKGRTARSLDSLLRAAKLWDVLGGRSFPDLDSALADVQSAVADDSSS